MEVGIKSHRSSMNNSLGIHTANSQNQIIRGIEYTHCRPQSSLQALQPFVFPCLSQDVEHILVHLDAAVFSQLALQLHTRLGDIRDVRERHLGGGQLQQRVRGRGARTATQAAIPPRMKPSAVLSGRVVFLVG